MGEAEVWDLGRRKAWCQLGGAGLAHSSFLSQIRGSRSRALPDRALVNCQYSSATFSTGEHKRRPHGDRKSCEMGLQLRQTFEAAILTQLHPRSQIDIYVQVSRQQPHPGERRELEGVRVGKGGQPEELMPLWWGSRRCCRQTVGPTRLV